MILPLVNTDSLLALDKHGRTGKACTGVLPLVWYNMAVKLTKQQICQQLFELSTGCSKS